MTRLFPIESTTVKLGYNELGYNELGYNEQIFESNWSFKYTDSHGYNEPRL